MANSKYNTRAEAAEARKRSNLKAQRKYRRKQKLLKRTTEDLQSDSIMDVEIAAEAPNATGSPDTTAENVSHGVQSATRERGGLDRPNVTLPASGPISHSTRNESRVEDIPIAVPSPAEHMARMEQAIDELLKNMEDPMVQQYLLSSIARIEPKFKALVGRVRPTRTLPVQPVERAGPIPQYRLYTVNAAASLEHRTTTETLRSLTEMMCGRSYAQSSHLAEVQLMRAQMDRESTQATPTLQCI
ncbi:hypothetical protein DDE82_008818 [Stemphylium lycopersici]|uniref:Uncharacterized protein n=1 Tax=Stemphylium lycopersici TaxID=183478 RepID=A0A364MT74_STELY|nr:hypothetical protein TW65_08873 [Stemphylium lycopersici]RAQ98877.1 hypothetical protein DDE82_008818 [Stemphylium lycopersici]RAR02666.1 hypothetical protein DDE83_008503 [Stemphylium lycopersici]